MKLLRNRKGFEAMEVGITILVIGTLLAISIPNFIRVTKINETDKQEITIKGVNKVVKEHRDLPFITSRMEYALQLRIANSLEDIVKILKNLNKGK